MSPAAPSLAARLRTTLLVVGVVQLLVVGLALAVFTSMRSEQERLTGDYFLTIQDSNRGFLTVLELEQAAVEYLRTAEAEALAEFQAALQPRDDAVPAEVLRERLAGDEEALAALDQVSGTAADWFASLQSLVTAVEQGGRGAVSVEQRRQQVADFERVRDEYDAYVDAVLEAREASRQRVEDRTSLLLASVLLAVGSSVVTGFVLYTALRSWVTRPVARLAAETRSVREGALDHRVEVAGPPEIVALGADVEAMRRGLVEQIAQVERAQQALEHQAEELRRSNRDLEQFAYVASHDLQEPLRKVSSFCQMLERRYKGQLDERADQYIAFAVDGAKRMQLLINDLLAFSRVGRMTDGIEDVAMESVLAEALRNLSTAVEESGAVITADPLLPVVPGERRLLVQLLQNLIGNALKFRGDEPPRVRVEARELDDAWELSVSDNGIGIEPQYADRIFVIFQRLHPKSEYEGTGIGLALCKKIVEHHGGTIWLDQQPGQGAVFRWTLPKQPPPRLDPEQVLAGDAERDDDEAPLGAEQEAAWTATPR